MLVTEYRKEPAIISEKNPVRIAVSGEKTPKNEKATLKEDVAAPIPCPERIVAEKSGKKNKKAHTASSKKDKALNVRDAAAKSILVLDSPIMYR
jgi:hypothetical protein